MRAWCAWHLAADCSRNARGRLHGFAKWLVVSGSLHAYGFGHGGSWQGRNCHCMLLSSGSLAPSPCMHLLMQVELAFSRKGKMNLPPTGGADRLQESQGDILKDIPKRRSLFRTKVCVLHPAHICARDQLGVSTASSCAEALTGCRMLCVEAVCQLRRSAWEVQAIRCSSSPEV